MKILNFLIAFCSFFLSLKAATQTRESDPGWQWARLSNTFNALKSEEILTDAENNTISFFYYNDSVFIEDTAFYHEENYASYSIAIVKRNSEGDFIKAVDIYTNPGEFLFNADLETDHESSIYLYGTFSDTLFINDTMIIRPEPGIDIYLLKLDKNLEFQWGRTISSAYQDDSEGIAVSEDGFIYLSAQHMNSLDTSHYMVNYFDQDSADVSGGLNSFLKVDKDGRIIWKAEIRDNYDGFAEIINTIAGSDGNIYLVGHATNDFYIQGDTIEFPSSPEYYMPGFIVQFDPDGMHHDAFFIPYPQFGYYVPETNIDADGNYIIAEEISETMIFGSDTIELSNDSTYAMIAKFDPSFQPIWHRGIKAKGNASTSFQIELIEDSIAFAFQGKSRFNFMGQEYVLNAIGQIFSGILSPDGELSEMQLTDASIGATLYSFNIDNCRNSLMDGLVRGQAHFGNDTLSTGYYDQHFLAKNAHIQPFSMEMPADTAGCGIIMLTAPAGYDYYWWNGVLSDQNWFQVTTTSVIHLKVASENCNWSQAASQVTIWPGFEFSLGNDTTILLTDTLVTAAPPGYDSYLWSTGDTTADLVIPAKQLQVGVNLLWLEISHGPCSATDTIRVTVIDDSGLQESLEQVLQLFPNPAKDYIRIFCASDVAPERIKICNQQGISIMEMNPGNSSIDVSFLKPGIYIVELVFKNEVTRKKLVIRE